MLEGNQRFNGNNYNIWKQRMLTIFEYKRLAQLVLAKILVLVHLEQIKISLMIEIERLLCFSNSL